MRWWWIYTLIRFQILHFYPFKILISSPSLNIICLQKLIKPTYIIASVFRGQCNLSYCNLNLHKIWNIRKNLVKFKSDSKKALPLWCTTIALRASSQIMAVVNSGFNRLSWVQGRKHWRGRGAAPLLPVFGRSVNPISTRAQIMPNILLLTPPPSGFSDLPTGLQLSWECCTAVHCSPVLSL